MITGVRFTEKNRVIFLQIEVGKLLPLGIIEQQTLHWQELPDFVDTDDVFNFNYDSKSFLLSEVQFENGVMTGSSKITSDLLFLSKKTFTTFRFAVR